MVAEILRATHPDVLHRASEVLRSGGLVAFPTDTVYGLAAMPWLDRAVQRLYVVKRRSESKAIPLLLSGADHLDRVALRASVCQRVIEAFWPGGLTLVFAKTRRVSEVVSAGPSVAVRVPDLVLARELIEAAGGILAVTSANISGGQNPATAINVREQLGGSIELIINGGACRHGVASTVLDCTVTPPKLLRAGAVSEADLRSALGHINTSIGG